MPVTQIPVVNGQRNGEILAFDFGNYQFAMIGAQDSCSLAHAGCSHVLGHGVAGIGHLNGGQLLGCKEFNFFVIAIFQQMHKRLVGLDINRAVTASTRQDAPFCKDLVHLVIDELVVVGVMSQAKADGAHHGHKMQRQHPIRSVAAERRDHDEQTVFLGIGLAEVVDDGDVVG